MNYPPWIQYTFLTLLVSTPFYLKMRSEGGSESQKFSQSIRSLLLIPGIVAFGYRIIRNTGFSDISLGAGRYPWLLFAAVFLPIGMEVLLIFVCSRFNLAQLDTSVFKIDSGTAKPSERIQLLMGYETQTIPFLIMNGFFTILVGILMTLVFSLSEEFGWRGLLQDEVIQTFGISWGLVIGGIAWGIWYIPLVLMGYKFPNHPKQGAYIYMPIFTISMGIIFGFLYWVSGSLWVPALANASTQVSSNISVALLGNAAGTQRVRLVWVWLWAVVAGLCLALWYSGTI